MTTDCYCTTLRTATRRLSALYDTALAPVGVGVAQWSLLVKLRAASGEPLSIQALAERAELERSTVARNVRVLERAGLVAMGHDPGDRRAATIELTAEGTAVLKRGAPLWRAAQQQVEEALGEAGAPALRSLLGAL